MPQRLAGGLLLLVLLLTRAPAQAPEPGETSTPLELRAALDEMTQLEQELERQRASERQARERLARTSASLQAASTQLRDRGTLDQSAQSALEHLSAERAAEREALAAEQAREREVLAGARAQRPATTARLLHALHRRASAATRAALALQLAAQRDAAAIASQRLLRAAAREAELAAAGTALDRAQASHSAFAQYTKDQLRYRHAELASELARLQAQTEASSETVAQLQGRRQAVRDLIAKLIADQAGRAAEPAPASTPGGATASPPSAGRIPAAPSNRPALPPLEPSPPATPDRPAVQARVDEVPYEPGSEPLVSATGRGAAAPEPAVAQPVGQPAASPPADPAGEADTRRLFWRASPVGVRALAAGTVVFAQPFAGYRHLLVIDHGGGWRSVLGNLETSPLAPGTRVAAGERLGTYAASPSQGLPPGHAVPLWFELRQGTQPVVPAACPWLSADWEARLFAP